MAKSTANDALIDRRRRRVAELVAQRFTQREITDTLAQEGFINLDTGEPFSLGTVNADIKVLRAGWQRDAKQAIGTHRADMLAEIQEVKRAAWGEKNLAIILKAIETQATLLGLNRSGVLDDLIDTEVKVTITRIDSRKAPPTRPTLPASAPSE